LKNNYRKLKFSILLQTVLVTALTVLVGGFLLNYVIDGIYNDSFARNFVKIMTKLQVSEPTARSLYWKLIGDNKTFFMVVGFLLLFALFFYVALSKMTKYLDQVGEGIENILSESTEPIHLITELKPIEIRLNEIKATLKRQELESVEGEKRKNDLVLFLAHDLKTPLTSIVAYLSMLDGYPKMPEEERKKYIHIALEIFEKFYRVDNSRSTGTGGAGLGLAIAKEIVELHDGQIMAKSDDLHTQFIVTLPSENELEENEEGSKNEIHTHRRHTFGGRPVHWKLPKGKAGKGDMDQS